MPNQTDPIALTKIPHLLIIHLLYVLYKTYKNWYTLDHLSSTFFFFFWVQIYHRIWKKNKAVNVLYQVKELPNYMDFMLPSCLLLCSAMNLFANWNVMLFLYIILYLVIFLCNNEWSLNFIWSLQRAIEEGADFIETDILATKDGALICSHDVTLDLDNRTNIANFSQFADRKRTYEVQGVNMTGWFVGMYQSYFIYCLKHNLQFINLTLANFDFV